MTTATCPFHVECSFYNGPAKTPSDELLRQFYCRAKFENCEITKRRREGKPVPTGACPDGNVCG